MLQMGTVNPCKKMGCSHMCVLAPGPRAVCKCPPGLLLAEDDLNCSNLVNSAFLLLLSLSSVTQVLLNALILLSVTCIGRICCIWICNSNV